MRQVDSDNRQFFSLPTKNWSTTIILFLLPVAMIFDKRNIAGEPQQWVVSKLFVLLTLLISSMSAFLLGCATKIHYQMSLEQLHTEQTKFDSITNNNDVPRTTTTYPFKPIITNTISNVSKQYTSYT